MQLGMFSADQVFSGRWYALITSAFVHVQPMHLFFNMYWLWILGPVLEREFGSLNLLAFIFGTAFVSSGWQLASGDGGIGFSGVGYAIIGFGWLAREYYPNLKPYFDDRTLAIFAGWGVICIFLDYFKLQNIGNVAHGMGSVCGALISLSFIKRAWLARVGLVFISVAAIVPVYWNPLSADWNFKMAYRASARNDFDLAIKMYKRSIELEPTLAEAWNNIALIELERGREKEFANAMTQLRKQDPKMADDLLESFGGKVK